jgi:DNA adenine methylase
LQDNLHESQKMDDYDAPFTYFGNKKHVATEVWSRLGNITTYYEPFFGTGSVFFSCPFPDRLAHIVLNDLDGMVANFWRAVKFSPQETAMFMDIGQHEIELHARLIACSKEVGEMTKRLVEDAQWCDPRLAGYWASVMSADITPRGCSLSGPWCLDEKGRLQKVRGKGVSFSKPNTDRKNCVKWAIDGVIAERLVPLHDALTNAYVLCGNWDRCFVDYKMRRTPIGIFFDPPYDDGVNKLSAIYRHSTPVSLSVTDWCITNGANPDFRICVAGYSGEHDKLVKEHGWQAVTWKGHGGYGRTAKGEEKSTGYTNRFKETLWFSPHCVTPTTEATLF